MLTLLSLSIRVWCGLEEHSTPSTQETLVPRVITFFRKKEDLNKEHLIQPALVIETKNIRIYVGDRNMWRYVSVVPSVCIFVFFVSLPACLSLAKVC